MKKNVTEELLLKLDSLPNQPGVYLMKDDQGRIIYIGKAKNLRARVRSYFQEGSHDGRRQLDALMQRVTSVDHILTETEQEALILEATQIKAHKPRYNILLKTTRNTPLYVLPTKPFRGFSLPAILSEMARVI